MISLSGTLDDATNATSRYPVSQITVERIAFDFTEISGLSIPYRVHKIQRSGSSFLATAYNAALDTIYYKKMSSVDASADWNSGWTSLSSSVQALKHDMFLNSDDALVVYSKSSNTSMYYKSSTNGGGSWGSESTLPAITSIDSIVAYAIADINTVYIEYETTSDGIRIIRAYRASPGSAWSLGTAWDTSMALPKVNISGYSESRWMWANIYDSDKHAILKPTWPGYVLLYGDVIYRYQTRQNDVYWPLRECLGGHFENMDYSYSPRGVSRPLNSYMFVGIRDRYGSKADIDAGLTYSNEFMIGRTVDFESYHLVPAAIDYGGSSIGSQYIAGAVLADGDENICIPVTNPGSGSSVWLTPKSSWWGYTGGETDITNSVTADRSISKAVRTAGTMNLRISNKGGEYNDHEDVKPMSIVRHSAGYVTGAGEELEDRFMGQIISEAKTVGADKTKTFRILDMLSRATAVKQNRAHILRGQNVFHANFSDPLEIDMFVMQGGTWQVQGGRLTSSKTTYNALALAGIEPNDGHYIITKIRFNSDITSSKGGLALAATSSASWMITPAFIYNDTVNKIQFIGLEPGRDDFAHLYTLYENSSGTYNWSADTNYWLMAGTELGRFYCYVSTDGATWSAVFTEKFEDDPFSTEGYPGLHAMPIGGSVSFDDVRIFSTKEPQSGSDVMRYLAAIGGIETNEKWEVDDTFTGTSFDSIWATPGVDGTWSVSGGMAQGYISATDPTTIRCSTLATDVIVKCQLGVEAADTGVIARANAAISECYAGTVSTTAAKIKKQVSGSWSTICSIPVTLSGTVDLKFMCRGKYITLFANGRLVAMAVDTSLEGEGYVGLVSSCSSGDPSDHYWFGIEGFYKPLDVVVIRPGDTTASIMNQIADLYDGGEFFCNESGELVWGIYDETSVDLDATDGRIIMYEETKDVGDVVSIERCEGDNAYAEARDTAWGSELMGHNYAQISSNIYQTGQACMDAATAEMEKTHRVTAESVTIKGHPGLQLGDIVTVDEPGGGGKNRRVKGFSEVIGTVYETTLSELESLDAEEPDG